MVRNLRPKTELFKVKFASAADMPLCNRKNRSASPVQHKLPERRKIYLGFYRRDESGVTMILTCAFLSGPVRVPKPSFTMSSRAIRFVI